MIPIIPESLLAQWQEIVDLVAKLSGTKASLIMRHQGHDIEVFVSSQSEGNPYHIGETNPLFGSGLYCEEVISTQAPLHVVDATESERWCNNPDHQKHQLISYLGLPIRLRTGEVFGTICILDDCRLEASAELTCLLEKMRDLIERQIAEPSTLAEDLTRARQAEQEVRASEQRFRNLFEHLPVPYQSLDIQGHWLDANQALADLLGFAAPQDMLGLDFGDYWDDTTRHQYPAAFSIFKSVGTTAGELRLRRRDGTSVSVILTGSIQRDENGAFVRTHCVITDITQRRTSEEAIQRVNEQLKTKADQRKARVRQVSAALEASEKRYRMLFNHLADATLILDLQGNIIAVNDQACRQYGYTREEMLTLHISQIHTPEDAVNIPSRLALINRQGMASFEAVHRDAQGRIIPIDARATKVMLDGRPAMLALCRDITEQKKAREQIEYQAYHDALTQLPNRLSGHDQLAHEVGFAHRHQTSVAVLTLDMDRFKYVNDTYGHTAGDQLLQSVAQRLRTHLREEDTLCRLSGDEFMVVLPEVESRQLVPDLSGICERLMTLLEAPYDLDTRQLFPSFSIGVAIYPQDGHDAEELMRHADTALYEAKRAGGHTYRFFEPEMNQALTRYVHTRDTLRQAIDQEQFELHYQPQICLRTGAVVGVEALLRWRPSEDEIKTPGDFIEVAENSGLIDTIGRWVLREACQQAASLRTSGWPGLVMSVNLSVVQFRRGRLELDVNSALNDSGLPPQCLELELTESSLLDSNQTVLDLMRHWKARGIKLAIDDFGTGYSSLAYLKRFRVDKLKIDQSFVKDLLVNDENRAIVRAIIQLAKTLNITTIAEGVENEALANELKLMGCDQAQGYLYAKALPAEELMEWLNRHPKVLPTCMDRSSPSPMGLRKDFGNIMEDCAVLSLQQPRQNTQIEAELRKSEALFRSFFNLPLVGTAITSVEKGWIEVNDRTCEILGYDREQLFLKNWAEITHPDDLAADVALFERMLAGEIDGYSLEKRFIRPDGSAIPCLLIGGRSHRTTISEEFFYVQIIDISERKQIEKALQQEKDRYRLLADNVSDNIWTTDLQGRFTYMSPSIENLMGYTVEEALQMSSLDFLTPAAREAELARVTLIKENLQANNPAFETTEVSAHECIRKDGTVIWVEVSADALRNGAGEIIGITGVSRDITARKQAEQKIVELNATLEQRVMERSEALVKTGELLQLALKATRDGLWDWNLSSHQVSVSESYWEILGYCGKELQGSLEEHLLELLPPDERSIVLTQMQSELDMSGSFSLEFRMRTRDGNYRWILSRGRVVEMDSSGKPLRAIGTHIDITDRRLMENKIIELNAELEAKVEARTTELREANQQLHRLASVDSLTGLWRRWHFEKSAEKEMDRTRRYGTPLSLVILDVDHFKSINDQYGHAVGDKVLVHLAGLLKHNVRSVDMPARWGGEEFVIMLPNTGVEDALILAEKLRCLIFSESFPVVGSVTLSAGIAELDPAQSFDEWFTQADDALYAAKAAGRNRVCRIQ